MKNKYFFLILFILFLKPINLVAEELNIKAVSIKLDKENSFLILDGDVQISDKVGNSINAVKAEYNKTDGLLITSGKTSIFTSQGYKIDSSDITYDEKKGIIKSNYSTLIIDKEGNKIGLQMFNYDTNKNIFFSKGKIKINDINGNFYNFSEIYIDEKKETIVGSDIRAFLNQEDIKINKDNSPRMFANNISINRKGSELTKGVFTYCKFRENEKCPPWSLQANKIEHNTETKTVYYKNAVLRVYDFPIFYFPTFFHPDPTVKRRSGFLNPSLVDSSNLGFGIDIPYFWNIANDKDLTFTPKLFSSNKPLLLSEYRQDFKNSFLIVDTGYTEGYSKTTSKKTSGARTHFFSKFNMDLFQNSNASSQLEVNLQKVSNDTYFKIYDIDTILVNKDENILENSLIYNFQKDDKFFGANFSAYENLNLEGHKRYEYLAPYITYDSNIPLDEKFGFLNFNSNFRVRNYDVNKQTELIVNALDWKSKKWINAFGFESEVKSIIKNVNYQAKNTAKYKNDNTNYEMSGVLGYVAKLPLFKANTSKDGKFGDKVFSIAMGQIISEVGDNDKPAPINQRFSDLVGDVTWNPNDNIKLKYQYSVDQNYKDLNFSDIGLDFILGATNFNINYLEEANHYGDQKYVKTGVELNLSSSDKFTFSSKRNLLTNSAEFYNLSYEYLNDCLKAGILFRREFYNDRDIEPENSLMFTITITPFTNINSPKFKR